MDNIQKYVDGNAPEIIEDIPSAHVLKCFKKYARRHIYTSSEVQKIEIAGQTIVHGLLEHYGMLLSLPRNDFAHFIKERTNIKNRDVEWRVFNQLSKRMINIYKIDSRNRQDRDEWICRARLIVDYISGMTDHTALNVYQNFMGISLT